MFVGLEADADMQHYRYWVIWRCPTVRFLDYQKVKDAEREKAAELFGTEDEPSVLASEVRLLFLIHRNTPGEDALTNSYGRSWAKSPRRSM